MHFIGAYAEKQHMLLGRCPRHTTFYGLPTIDVTQIIVMGWTNVHLKKKKIQINVLYGLFGQARLDKTTLKYTIKEQQKKSLSTFIFETMY